VHPPAEASRYAQCLDFHENESGTLGGFGQVRSAALWVLPTKRWGDIWIQPRGPTSQMGDPLFSLGMARLSSPRVVNAPLRVNQRNLNGGLRRAWSHLER
jgi:hypothetical protein